MVSEKEQAEIDAIKTGRRAVDISAFIGAGDFRLPITGVNKDNGDNVPYTDDIKVYQFDTDSHGNRPFPSRVVSSEGLPRLDEDERELAARGLPVSYRTPDASNSSCDDGVGQPPNDSRNDLQYVPWEIVIGENGQPRQAGVLQREGQWVNDYRVRAERRLFVFLRGILGRFFLTKHFHRDMCDFLQKCPPFRKMMLMPREHAKTAITSGGLPAHILIQPEGGNIYFPGLAGSDCRILMAGETANMAQKNLRVVQSVFTENRLVKAFWPHCCWENTRQSPQWNNEGIIIPRKNEWPDPSIKAVGVGGAITGARPNVEIKDDLVTFDAAHSETIMDMAIEWHIASRALLDTYEVESGLQSLEFIVGTRWAVFDLYSYIIDNDPSVEVNDEKYHRIVRDGKILWPEKYTMEMIDQLRHEHKGNFYLLYLNNANDPSLTTFDVESIREFRLVDGKVYFEENEKDEALVKRYERKVERESGAVKPLPVIKRGEPLNDVLKRIKDTGRGFRLKVA